MRRDEIKLCYAPNGSRYRLDAVMNGEIEAATLTEPHVTLAEKKGCRTSARPFSMAPKSPPTGSMLKPMPPSIGRCARRFGASTPTSAPISTTSSIITARPTPRWPRSRSRICAEGRLVVCDPAPIPLDEMQRTYDWLKSWDMLEETASPLQLVNLEVQNHAHQAAEYRP